MSSWTTNKLTADTWEPAQFLPSAWLAAPPSYGGPASPLADLATLLPIRGRAGAREDVATPGFVDRDSGAIIKLRPGRDEPSCLFEDGLRERDILVPTVGDGPCVLVSDEHRALAFVGFLPLRASRSDAASLWALLTCESGARARRAMMEGGIGAHLHSSRLMSLAVPDRPPAEFNSLMLAHHLPNPAVNPRQQAIRRSEWGTVQLEAADWRRSIALLGLEHLGPLRLGDIATISARPTKVETVELPMPGHLPVADGRWVARGARVSRWTLPESKSLLVAPGDVVLSCVGPFRARVMGEEMALIPNIAKVEPGSDIDGPSLANFLNSETGQVILNQLASGVGLPRLGVQTLRDLPIPSLDVLRACRPGGRPTAQSLAQRLEAVLWPA